MTPETNYKEVLANFKNRLREIDGERADLEVRRADLDKEALHVKEMISKLMPLCGETASEDDVSGLGFTDAVLTVVQLARGERLSAQQIKERLAEKGFEISGYTNPMASIYKILARLEEAKKIIVEREGFSSFYKAKTSDIQRAADLLPKVSLQPPPSVTNLLTRGKK